MSSNQPAPTNFLTIATLWSMVKRPLIGAVMGFIVAGLAGIGIDAALDPELLENIERGVNALLFLIFYGVTVLYRTWRQRVLLKKGEVLPERIESAATAREHGVTI